MTTRVRRSRGGCHSEGHISRTIRQYRQGRIGQCEAARRVRTPTRRRCDRQRRIAACQGQRSAVAHRRQERILRGGGSAVGAGCFIQMTEDPGVDPAIPALCVDSKGGWPADRNCQKREATSIVSNGVQAWSGRCRWGGVDRAAAFDVQFHHDHASRRDWVGTERMRMAVRGREGRRHLPRADVRSLHWLCVEGLQRHVLGAGCVPK